MPNAVRIDPAPAGPSVRTPTAGDRRALLRALLLGRGLERALADRSGAARDRDRAGTVLTAIAAAAGLGPQDRLVTTHELLSAHLGLGAALAAVAAARLGADRAETGGLRGGIGGSAAAAIAVGVAFGLRRNGRGGVAAAILDRRWAETEPCRQALALARDLALPVVVVAIDAVARATEAEPAADRRLEAVRERVAAAATSAQAASEPELIVCEAAGPEPADTRNRTRLSAQPLEPLAAYARRLILHGFARADLETIRVEVSEELGEALG